MIRSITNTMSKTTTGMAKKWGLSTSTVRRYCSTGIIPSAEQIGLLRRWSIPDEAEKPPLSRHGLCLLLDTIYQLNNGVDYKSLKWGHTKKNVKAGYNYLVSCAFMSTINTNNLEKELINARVTPRGEELIKRENDESKGKTNYKAYISGKISVGVASVEGGIELTNKE